MKKYMILIRDSETGEQFATFTEAECSYKEI